jgi:hypothetical protein
MPWSEKSSCLLLPPPLKVLWILLVVSAWQTIFDKGGGGPFASATYVVVVPTNPMPTYVKNYLLSGNTGDLLAKHYFNSTQRLLLVVKDAWPYLGNTAQAAISQSSEAPLNKRVMMSRNKRAYINAASSILNPSATIVIDPDPMAGSQNNATSSATLPWGLDRVDQRSLPLDGAYAGYNSSVNSKRTVHLYILDTGVYPHADFPSVPHQDFNYFPSDPFGDCNGA